MAIVTKLRYYHYIAGVFANQQHDPLCCACKAFKNSVDQVQQNLNAFVASHEAAMKALPEHFPIMLADIKMMMAELTPLSDAAGQKKAGNCLLPEGVCFVKSSKALYERISD